MRDPIVAEVRQYRMEHTRQFHSDLARSVKISASSKPVLATVS